MKGIRVGERTIAEGGKIFVIAEMAWSHDGSYDKAKAIIKGTADAGADAISVHVTHMDSYMTRDFGSKAGQTTSAGKESTKIYDYLDKINIKREWWVKLFDYAKSLGLAVCAMPNDQESLKFCDELKPDMYVIAAACFVEEDFIRGVAKKGKPVILRIGGATRKEIEQTIAWIRQEGNEEIVLLHGIQTYPTKIEDMHLNLIQSLKETFGLPVGLADHVDAESELALIIPLLAIPLGACVIEKHLTYDRSARGEDFEAALDPSELKKLVGYIDAAEKALGESGFRISESESKYRLVSRKRAVAGRVIKAGEKLAKDMITFKRCDNGLYPDEVKSIIGRRAKRELRKDEPLTQDNFV
ncbi:MAG: N-acetylneuraminate synthase family protein [Candidatus Altiarchaeota archaeon]|nr:N-acetylneuraminate synthase family protein [Candidatus Altiarchaeota archaeon]